MPQEVPPTSTTKNSAIFPFPYPWPETSDVCLPQSQLKFPLFPSVPAGPLPSLLPSVDPGHSVIFLSTNQIKLLFLLKPSQSLSPAASIKFLQGLTGSLTSSSLLPRLALCYTNSNLVSALRAHQTPFDPKGFAPAAPGASLYLIAQLTTLMPPPESGLP